MKEKVPKMQRSVEVLPPVKNCEYQNMCNCVWHILGLPGERARAVTSFTLSMLNWI
jgi:hypothetical protein